MEEKQFVERRKLSLKKVEQILNKKANLLVSKIRMSSVLIFLERRKLSFFVATSMILFLPLVLALDLGSQSNLNMPEELEAEGSDPRILPGDMFYWFKVQKEFLQKLMTENDQKKAELHLMLAEERLKEAKVLILKEDLVNAEKALIYADAELFEYEMFKTKGILINSEKEMFLQEYFKPLVEVSFEKAKNEKVK